MNKVFGKIADYAPIKEDASRVIVSYGYETVDEENATWREVYIYKKQVSQVTLADVKAAVVKDINARTDEQIVGGFSWNGKPVWLSAENQRNFAEASRIGLVPVTFKLGEEEDGTPVYHTFESAEELASFYREAFGHISQCLSAGWEEKDGVVWAPYESNFPAAEEQAME